MTYLEFRADFTVELRFEDGRIEEIPFLKLPISKLPGDFFPITCRTCVDLHQHAGRTSPSDTWPAGGSSGW